MTVKRRGLFALGISILLWFSFAPLGWARLSYFPFQDVQQGMEAVGKTVFYGTKVEDFRVEVIDVVRGKSLNDSYFVIQVKDQRVKSLGGISAGMSGSPIYIKGKIAGALAYSWETQDNLVGVVTPIEAMLSIWKEEEAIVPLNGSGSSVVFLRGFQGRAGELLAQTLQADFSLRRVFTLPSFLFWGRAEEKNHTLEPGGAIGIQLLTGDAEILSIGTLTFRDGERILALGHPFLHRGKVSYFLSSVYVNFSLKGEEFPFKVGTSLETVGMIDQDRGVGVSGRIGTLPEGSEIHVTVKEGSKKGDYHYTAVRDSAILLEILPKVILDSVDRTIDSQTPGSGNVRLKMEKADFSLQEEFFMISDTDIGSTISDSMGKVLEMILANPYQDAAPEKMELDIEIFPDIQKGWLLATEFPRIVKRGETAEGRISFFLYRQGERTIAFPFTVPADFAAGEAEVIVQGRGSGEESSASPGNLPPTLGEYLQSKFEEFRRNGVKIEVVAKMESSDRYKTYFAQNIYLPVILEGNFSSKVWIN
ncbi:MAG: SpoIVB peptidase S55 domain-containing protein [Candidatus Caldatribacteriaceae bacterium]